MLSGWATAQGYLYEQGAAQEFGAYPLVVSQVVAAISDLAVGNGVALDAVGVVPVAARGLAQYAALFAEVEDGSSVTYSWSTDVMETRSGLEFRIALIGCPRERYEFSITLSDAQIALLQGQLITAAAAGAAFGVGLQWESLLVTASSSGATVTVPTTTLSDWCYPGQTVVVQAPDGTPVAATLVQSVSTTTITLAVSVSVAPGYRIVPTIPCYLNDPQGLALYPIGAGRYTLRARATYFGNATSDWSPVGATVSTYTDGAVDGVTYPVFDRPILVDGTSPLGIMPGTMISDYGGVLMLTAPRPVSDKSRQILFRVRSDADRQYLKAFHGAVRGRQGAFLLPTWKPDLVPIGDASGGTLTIKSQADGGTDFAGGIFPAEWHLQLLKTTSAVVYATVTDAVDNLDGTQTLDLDAPVAGALSMVSLLERCRLDTDDVAVKYSSAGLGTCTMPVRVVRQ